MMLLVLLVLSIMIPNKFIYNIVCFVKACKNQSFCFSVEYQYIKMKNYKKEYL